jgi:hypothetical protein
MEDEGHTFRGRNQVKQWAQFNSTITIHAHHLNSQFLVSTIFDGDFVEAYRITEPFPLDLYFPLDGNHITTVKMSDLPHGKFTTSVIYTCKPDTKNPLSALAVGKRLVPTSQRAGLKSTSPPHV